MIATGIGTDLPVHGRGRASFGGLLVCGLATLLAGAAPTLGDTATFQQGDANGYAGTQHTFLQQAAPLDDSLQNPLLSGGSGGDEPDTTNLVTLVPSAETIEPGQEVRVDVFVIRFVEPRTFLRDDFSDSIERQLGEAVEIHVVAPSNDSGGSNNDRPLREVEHGEGGGR